MCILPGKTVSEMIYTVTSGTLNFTHSHSRSPIMQVSMLVNYVHVVADLLDPRATSRYRSKLTLSGSVRCMEVSCQRLTT